MMKIYVVYGVPKIVRTISNTYRKHARAKVLIPCGKTDFV